MKQNRVWFTSDLHINHKLVAGKRGFWLKDQDGVAEPNVYAHDDFLAAVWDTTVAPGDTVYVLGDTGIGRFSQVVLPWFEARPGTKHLISGNHDPVFVGHSKWKKDMREWLEVFESVQSSASVKLAGRKVLLSHFPYEEWGEGPARGGESRYNEFRFPDKGLPLLHGHTHGTEVAHGHSYHVGLDAHALELVPQESILEWLNTLD